MSNCILFELLTKLLYAFYVKSQKGTFSDDMTAKTISTDRNIDKQLEPHEPQQKLTLFKFSCECVKVIHSFLFSASLCSNCVLCRTQKASEYMPSECIPSSTCLPVNFFQCMPSKCHSFTGRPGTSTERSRRGVL